MKRAIVLGLTGLVLTGCASFQAQRTKSTEQILGEAGFQIRTADTPEALAYLQSLPAKKLLVRSAANGGSQYAYADPTGCKCLYVGTEAQYQELRKLQQARQVVAEQLRDIERQDALYDLWRGTSPSLQ